MKELTTKQTEIIADNLRAFTVNFGAPRIVKGDISGFYVYYPADAESYIQYCYDVHYLNGWLYGVVQGHMRKEFSHSKLDD